MLKKVEFTIRPYKLDDIKAALENIGIFNFSISRLEIYGKEKGPVEIYRGVEYILESISKLKIETVIPEEWVDKTVSVIMNTVRNGRMTDDKIYIIPIEQVVHIQTGALNESAV